jgi:hypothetical protein
MFKYNDTKIISHKIELPKHLCHAAIFVGRFEVNLTVSLEFV